MFITCPRNPKRGSLIEVAPRLASSSITQKLNVEEGENGTIKISCFENPKLVFEAITLKKGGRIQLQPRRDISKQKWVFRKRS